MTSANVSAAPVMPVQVQGKSKGMKQGEAKDFMAIMNASIQKNSASDIQSSVGVAAPAKTEKQAAVVETEKPVKIDTPAAKVEQDTKAPDKATAEASDVKPDTLDGTLTEEEVTEVSEVIATAVAEITQTIAEDMGVPVEEVTDALESLEITPLELADPKNLTDLISELTDQTGAELITDPAFSEVKTDLASIMDELVSKLPVESTEELPGFAREFMQMIQKNTVGMDLGPNGEVVPTPEFTDELAADSLDITVIPESENLTEQPVEKVTTVTPEQGRVVAAESRPYIAVDEKMDADEAEAVETYNDTADEMVTTARTMGSENSGDTAKRDGSQSDPFSRNTHAGVEVASANVAENTTSTVQTNTFTQTVTEAVTRYTSIDTRAIIEQIVTQVRTSVTEGISTMALELHPASLGKMYVQVTEQDGTINAKLFAENENVKNALETQMSVLKEQWEQQGTKVNAVEISVGTREFERQMESQNEWNENGGSGSEGTNGSGNDNAEGGAGRRSINLGDAEDGIPEDMTEAEALEANMMRDYGNTLSMRA